MTPSRILEEIRQKVPFPSPRQEAIVALLRTADVARRALSLAIEPTGITPQQYNVLRILRGAGDDGLPTLEIATRMIERSPGVTRLLDRLEEKGLVRRERCRADRRQVLCWIAPAGVELLARLDGPVRDAAERLLAGVTAAELDELLRLLDAVRQSIPDEP